MSFCQCHTLSFFQFQIKVNTTFIIPRPATVTPPADMHHDFCKLKPLSTKEALEEQRLLDSIAWPETPSLPSPLSLSSTSHPAHSAFTILPRWGGGQWHIGDKLEVMIQMHDFQGHLKRSGGDVLLARLHNITLGAGVAGQVLDHLNGSYSAIFTLLWEGNAQVQVTLTTLTNIACLLLKLTSSGHITRFTLWHFTLASFFICRPFASL